MIEKNYRAFHTAFVKYCLEKGQNVVTIELERSTAYVNQIFKDKKNTSLKTQNSIAKKLGFTYEDFLNYGEKELPEKSADVDPGHHDLKQIQDRIEKEHQDLIKRFKDKEAGKEANEYLLTIEQLDAVDFYKAIGILKGMAIKLRQKQEDQAHPQNVGGKKAG